MTVVKSSDGADVKKSRSVKHSKRPKPKKDSWLKGFVILVLLALLATAVIVKKLRLWR
jgi:hypothetical protein